jgi:hypothetical protein
MLNKKQVEIADFLLKHLESRGGKSSLDDYPEKLRKQGFDDFDWHTLVKILIDHLGLLDYAGNSDYWIMLTPEGNKAAKIGIEKYFDEIEQDKQLDRNEKLANISGVDTAKRTAKISIFLSIIAVFISVTVPFLTDKKSNNGINQNATGYENGQAGHQIDFSKFPFQWADTVFIEKVKYSLKHDSVFLNDIKQLINNESTKN